MTPAVYFGGTVTLGDPPSPAQIRVLAVTDEIARLMGVEMWVTCGKEGHPLSDPHSKRLALDVRTKHLSDAQILTAYDYYKKRLGPQWTPLYECPTKPTGVLATIAYVNQQATATHFHLQPVKGTTWPPTS